MLSNVWATLSGLGVALLLGVGAYFKGFSSGKNKVEKDALQAAVYNTLEANKIRNTRLNKETIQEYLDVHDHK